jgi:hypothetical protein
MIGDGAVSGARALLAALLLAAGLTVAMASHQAAWASGSTGPSVDKAGEPIFGLPPIMVQVPDNGGPELKIVLFKAALVFDEVDPERINDSQRIAKTVLPKIMDSVITGMQRHHFTDKTTAADVSRLVLDRSNAVLKPYGVIIKKLKMEHLAIH